MVLLCEGIFISSFKTQAAFAFMHCLEINNKGYYDANGDRFERRDNFFKNNFTLCMQKGERKEKIRTN